MSIIHAEFLDFKRRAEMRDVWKKSVEEYRWKFVVRKLEQLQNEINELPQYYSRLP